MLTDLDRLIDVLPIGVYVCEAPGGAIRLYNRRAVELWGREPIAADRFCGSHRLFDAAGRPSRTRRRRWPWCCAARAPSRGGDPRAPRRLARHGVHDRQPASRRGWPPGRRRRGDRRRLEPQGDGGGAARERAPLPCDGRGPARDGLPLPGGRHADLREPRLPPLLRDSGRRAAVEPRAARVPRRPATGSRRHREPDSRGPERDRREPRLPRRRPGALDAVGQPRASSTSPGTAWSCRRPAATSPSSARTARLDGVAGRDRGERRRRHHQQDARRHRHVLEPRRRVACSATRPTEAIGRPITHHHPARSAARRSTRSSRGCGAASAIDHFETERITKDGRLLPVSLTVSPVRDAAGRVIGASKIARDNSEQRARTRSACAATRADAGDALPAGRPRSAAPRGRGGGGEAGTRGDPAGWRAPAREHPRFRRRRRHALPCLVAASPTATARPSRAIRPGRADAADPQPILVEDVSRRRDLGAAPARGPCAKASARWASSRSCTRAASSASSWCTTTSRTAFSSDELRLATTVAQHVSFGLARVDAERGRRTRLLRARAGARGARPTPRASRGRSAPTAPRTSSWPCSRTSCATRSASIVQRDRAPGLEPGARRRARQRAIAMVRRQARPPRAAARRPARRRAHHQRPHRAASERPCDLRSRGRASRSRPSGPMLDAKEQQLAMAVAGRAGARRSATRSRLQQVLGNLLTTPPSTRRPGGSIRVGSRREDGEAVLRVRDDGAGIPRASSLDSIFELFAQANPTLARDRGRARHRAHAGASGSSSCTAARCARASEGLGQGAEFTVRLPLAGAAARRGRSAAPNAQRAGARGAHPGRRGQRRRARGARARARARRATRCSQAATGQRRARGGAREPARRGARRHRPAGHRRLRGGAPRCAPRLGAGVQLVALTGYGQPRGSRRARARPASTRTS